MEPSSNHLFLMDCWKAGIFEQLLDFDTSVESVSEFHEKQSEFVQSKIGRVVWEYKDNFNLQSEEVKPVEAENSFPDAIQEKRERRVKAGDSIVKAIYKDIINSTDPHLLIPPFKFGEPGLIENETQPFKVLLHPQVPLICDVHAHVSEAEIIGFLAGKWIGDERTLYIQAAVPCTSTHREEDDGATDVELDPEAEFLAREIITEMSLQVVGWYHSHPKFRADPSLIDVQNQLQYQSLMKDEVTGLEPFLGLIISTYDKLLVDGKSNHTWFAVRPYTDEKGMVVHMPIELQTQVLYNRENNVESSNDSTSFQEEEILALQPSLLDWRNRKALSLLPPVTTTSSTSSSSKSSRHRKGNKSSHDNNHQFQQLKEDSTSRGEESSSVKIEAKEESDFPLSEKSDFSEIVETEQEDTDCLNLLSLKGERDIVPEVTEEEAVEKKEENELQSSRKLEEEDSVHPPSLLEPANSDSPLTTAMEITPAAATAARPKRRARKPKGFYLEDGEDSASASTSEKRKSSRTPKPSTFYDQDYISPRKNNQTVNGKSKRKCLFSSEEAEESQSGKRRKVQALKKKEEELRSQLAVIDNNALPTERRGGRGRKAKVKESSHPSNGKEMKSNDRSLLDSFVLSLQHPSLKSSTIARGILRETPAYLRFPAVCLLSIGYHFSRYSRRLDLLSPWRKQIKLDKLAASAMRWSQYFLVTDPSGESNPHVQNLLTQLLEFLRCCWEEFSKRTGKVKVVK